MKSAYLVLENGMTFAGESFGAEGTVVSEIVFSTGMTGYIETLTDKSYFGQAVVHTFPLIGNYGIISSDFDGDVIGPKAYIVKEWCQEPSNFRCEGNLDAFLKSRGIVGLCGIDTRALTKVLRENGVMNGVITDNPDSVNLEELKNYKIENAVSTVSVREPELYKAEDAKFTVAMLDFGFKKSEIESFNKRGLDVWVMPFNSTLSDIKAKGAQGVILSNGPGNPADNADIIENIKEISESGMPVFGIGLGHQLVALAWGFETEKLKYGHRGANQPVKNLQTGKIYITSQNHGYAVKETSVDKTKAEVFLVNNNDGTVEGIEYKNFNAVTCQFQPEICGGVRSSANIADKFINMMEVRPNA